MSDNEENEKTDEQLAAEGNFKELMRRYVPLLAFKAKKEIHCDIDIAYFLAGETFAKISTIYLYNPNKKGKKTGKTMSFRNWLFLVHRSTIRDWKKDPFHINTEPIEINEDDEDGYVREFGHFNTPEKNLLLGQLLQQCLQTLNPEEIEVINFREKDGLPFEEIALLLKEPKSTVGSRHKRALEKLKKCLELKGITGVF